MIWLIKAILECFEGELYDEVHLCSDIEGDSDIGEI